MIKIDTNRLMETDFLNVEFFMFLWSASKRLSVDIIENDYFAIDKGKNFLSITSKCPHSGKGLLRIINNSYLLFRGYELDLGVHTYSEKNLFESHPSPLEYKNGVFTLAVIDGEKRNLSIKTDAFGVSPIYYRKYRQTYIFASHPILIALEEDELNLFTFMSLLQTGFIYGDHTIFKDILRVPQGSLIEISQEGMDISKWYEFSKLPEGTELLTKNTYQQIEEHLQAAIDKCCNLNLPNNILPFSSGYDSRRLLANLDKDRKDFTLVTCQTYYKKNGNYYDIDSVYAPKIAKKLGYDTIVINETNIENLCFDVKTRSALIGSECFFHQWSIPLIKWFRKQPPSIIFDGLGGDVLGEGGYWIDGLHETPHKDLDIIINNEIVPGIFKFVNSQWPNKEEYIHDYKNEICSFPCSLNRVELSFLQFRTRRAISPWITMMHPPGHVSVFPYYDLNYIETCLKYHPKEKNKLYFQKECLRKFWPNISDMEGTRKLPQHLRSVPKKKIQKRGNIERDFIFASVGNLPNSHLNYKSRIEWEFIKKIPWVNKRSEWFYLPLSKLFLIGEGKKIIETV